MVVFDLEQTHIVRGVTIAKPEKWTVNYKWNSDDPLIWLSEGGKLEVKLSITPVP
jgi:hypothetical protein